VPAAGSKTPARRRGNPSKRAAVRAFPRRLLEHPPGLATWLSLPEEGLQLRDSAGLRPASQHPAACSIRLGRDWHGRANVSSDGNPSPPRQRLCQQAMGVGIDHRVELRQISSYSCHVRRKAGALLPIEVQVLEAATGLGARGEREFHGYELAKEMAMRRVQTPSPAEARRLVAHGTLYKALDRLEAAGLIESRWEDPEPAHAESRPRRRLYRLLAAGTAALARARREAQAPAGAPRLAPGRAEA
jgi:PadR family transcriptional regulator PadR